MENRAIISRRKALKKSTAKELGILVNQLEWRNGQLIDLRDQTVVPDVERISKPPKASAEGVKHKLRGRYFRNW
jgi:hypothetical protein